MSDTSRNIRALTRAQIKRDEAIAGIDAILEASVKVSMNSSLVPSFLEMSRKSELLWANFQAENDAVLDELLNLVRSSEFSTTFGNPRKLC